MRSLLRLAVLALGVIAALEMHATKPPAPVATVTPMAKPIIIPVDGVQRDAIRPMFHARRAGHEHQALDILAPRGTRVFAAVDGTIRKLFTSRAGGLTIYEFDRDQKRVFYYAHLDRYANIREGMPVRQGDTIGFVGTTGNAPPGTPHLHFAIGLLPATKEWWKGVAIDPYPLLTGN